MSFLIMFFQLPIFVPASYFIVNYMQLSVKRLVSRNLNWQCLAFPNIFCLTGTESRLLYKFRPPLNENAIMRASLLENPYEETASNERSCRSRRKVLV